MPGQQAMTIRRSCQLAQQPLDSAGSLSGFGNRFPDAAAHADAEVMTQPQFDAEGLFTDDYLYFFADHLEERSDAEADLIWRLLGLEPGMEVLDLACGHGRIANRLAGRGCRVTGLDSTELFLDHARRDAAERNVTVEYVHGDMRELPWRDRFDAIFNWFTAKRPSTSAGTTRLSPVSLLVTVILALGTEAPAWSVTVPLTSAVI